MLSVPGLSSVRSILLFRSTLDVRRSMFDVRVSRGPRAALFQSTTPHAERMNTNTEHPTSNAQRRTEEANITARTAHLSLLVLFGSTLNAERALASLATWRSSNWHSTAKRGNVRRSMFDVRVSRGPRAALFQSTIHNTSRRKNEYEHRTLPPAMPVRASPVFSKLASARSAFNIERPTSNRRGEHNSQNGPSFSPASLRFDVGSSALDVRCSPFQRAARGSLPIQNCLRPCQFGLRQFPSGSLAITPRSKSKI